MRHRKRKLQIGRKPAHVRALLANQVCSLIFEERIQTTVPKAKETRRLAEKMLTLGKRGELAQRRRAVSILHNKDAVAKLFDEIAPRYADRNGGYTRIMHLGTRAGDAGNVCLLEWVESRRVPTAATEPTEPAEEAPVEVTDAG